MAAPELRLGTRGSQLALWQANTVAAGIDMRTGKHRKSETCIQILSSRLAFSENTLASSCGASFSDLMISTPAFLSGLSGGASVPKMK